MWTSFTGRTDSLCETQFGGRFRFPSAIQLGRQRGHPAVQLPNRVRYCPLLQYRLPQPGLDAIDLGLSTSGELRQSSLVSYRGCEIFQ